MTNSKHYIIVDIVNKYYPYNINVGIFSSDISEATLRTYEECEKMCISIYFHTPHIFRKCVIKNIRKIKLEMLNNTINGTR